MALMIYPHIHSGASFEGLRIGLLGGSFNPAHEGHRAMSLYALKRLGLDQIWWLVTPQNPLKPAAGMADFAERMAGARKLARHPRILVTDLEQQFGTRYTVDTLQDLHRRFSRTRFVWLMGADNLYQISRWQRWEKIFASVTIAVFRRLAERHPHAAQAAIRFARFRLPVERARRLIAACPPAWLVLDNPLNLLSATLLRQQEKENRTWPDRKRRKSKRPPAP